MGPVHTKSWFVLHSITHAKCNGSVGLDDGGEQRLFCFLSLMFDAKPGHKRWRSTENPFGITKRKDSGPSGNQEDIQQDTLISNLALLAGRAFWLFSCFFLAGLSA